MTRNKPVALRIVGERLNRRQWLGVALDLAGVAMVAWKKDRTQESAVD
jgi:drug/metabolite transporter (DMT)-like permease